MHCSACDATIDADANFCPRCGSPQGTVATSVLPGQRVIEADGLLVEYSAGRAPSGEWFAIGSVFAAPVPRRHPAWIIVGTGESPVGAVDSLRDELRREASRQRGAVSGQQSAISSQQSAAGG